jgi:hypothetical protein
VGGKEKLQIRKQTFKPKGKRKIAEREHYSDHFKAETGHTLKTRNEKNDNLTHIYVRPPQT